jgi:tRNA(Ile)-lysidine synthase
MKPLETWAYELLSPYGFNLSNVNDIISLEEAIPGKEVVSVTHRLLRDRDHLIIVPLKSTPQKSEYFLTSSDLQHKISEPVNLSFEILHEVPVKFDDPKTAAYLALEKLTFPLRIRKWSRGDFFYPLGMSQPKKLSDFFIDEKFSKIDKENQWLLCSGNDIAWIIGYRIDDRFKIVPGCGKILKITIAL